MEQLCAAAAEIEITPPAGLPMDGYLTRSSVSVGVHDPLLGQALVLAYGAARAALVTLDVLAVSAVFADRLRRQLADALKTAPDAVMVCASHTHAGPAGLQTWFPAPESSILSAPVLDAQLASMIESRLMEAARRAVEALAPARLVYGIADVVGVGGDRLKTAPPAQRGASADSPVTALRFDRLDDAPAAIVFHYACHPTVLGAGNLLYSADFPGAARLRIQEVYPRTPCLFLNGAAGNISTRYFRRDQSFEEVSRLGQSLGDYVIAALNQAHDAPLDRLQWASRRVELPIRSFPETGTQTLSSTGDARIDQTRAEGAALQNRLSRLFQSDRASAGRPSQTARLHALHIGPWALLGVPGEPFDALAQVVRQAAPFGLVVGYADDYLGYFPTQSAIDAAAYEALSSPYDARAHHIIQAALLQMISS